MFKIEGGLYNSLQRVRNITHDLFKCGNSLSELCVGHFVSQAYTAISIYAYLDTANISWAIF